MSGGPDVGGTGAVDAQHAMESWEASPSVFQVFSLSRASPRFYFHRSWMAPNRFHISEDLNVLPRFIDVVERWR